MGCQNAKFSENKLETVLKTSMIRLELLNNKKLHNQSELKEQIFALAQMGQFNSAEIKTESFISNEGMLDIIAELKKIIPELISSVKIIDVNRTCLSEFRKNVIFLIYCSGRCGCEELVQAKTLFAEKYGQSFVSKAEHNTEGILEKSLTDKLRFDNILEESKKQKLNQILEGRQK
jgi:Regulator of Vps4 activity in the MVB pathway